jgi:hypothetical protein
VNRYTSQDDGKARVRGSEDKLAHLGARHSKHDVPQVNGEIEALMAHVKTTRELLDQQSAPMPPS